MRTHPIVEYYQALRDSAPCLSRAATLPKGTKLGLGKRRAPGNTIILSQPYRRRVSTDRLNREGSQLAASLEGEPGPTPAGKTLPHSFPETSRFRRERARDLWNALEKKYNSNTKEAGRANHEYLHNTKMKSGDDPDDFLYIMDDHRERLEGMGQPVPDERYEGIILQALPAEYERVRTASYERQNFHLADI